MQTCVCNLNAHGHHANDWHQLDYTPCDLQLQSNRLEGIHHPRPVPCYHALQALHLPWRQSPDVARLRHIRHQVKHVVHGSIRSMPLPLPWLGAAVERLQRLQQRLIAIPEPRAPGLKLVVQALGSSGVPSPQLLAFCCVRHTIAHARQCALAAALMYVHEPQIVGKLRAEGECSHWLRRCAGACTQCSQAPSTGSTHQHILTCDATVASSFQGRMGRAEKAQCMRRAWYAPHIKHIKLRRSHEPSPKCPPHVRMCFPLLPTQFRCFCHPDPAL
ncbi:hypothetical protein COO60DRAFT_1139208 [Scenedesmus sp. NREL 46B-D3]|nr:hypothetical protein COO60DRAFT_1139208 [Scenedesmus sp. NREL 46B-D3]